MLSGECLPRKSLFLIVMSGLVSSSRRIFSLQVGVQSPPRRSESSCCFTASLFFAGRGRVASSVSSSQREIVFLFHGDAIARKRLFLEVLSFLLSCTLLFFTASLFLAGRGRVSSSQIGSVFCFTASLFLGRVSSMQP